MKKFVAILLTLMLVLGMTAAIAEETTTYTDMDTITLTKVYELTNEGTISPEETFTFEKLTCTDVTDAGVGVTKDNAPMPTIGNVTYAQGEAGSANKTKTITIDLPEYTAVGKYTYTFYETNKGTAGVTYRSEPITLVVYVIEQDGKIRVAGVNTSNETGTKTDKFTNTYSAGELNITKTVTGNLGDKEKYFEFKVTLNGEAGKTYGESYAVDGGSYATNPTSIQIGVETTFMLKHGDTINIANLPYGVRYTVTETAAEDYTITEKTGDSGTIDKASQTAAFTNTKSGTIDTGVTTESLPYVVLMGFVVLAGAALLLKRKAHNN